MFLAGLRFKVRHGNLQSFSFQAFEVLWKDPLCGNLEGTEPNAEDNIII